MKGKSIVGYERYQVMEDGTVRNRDGYALKPDKGGCVSLHVNDKRKSFSIARLVAIHYLGMPDDKKHKAYRKDKNAGFGSDNVAWDSVSNLNKERLAKARQAKIEYANECEEEIYEEVID